MASECSVEMEIDFLRDLYRDWIAIFLRRLEFPGFNRAHGCMVETTSERQRDMNVGSIA